MWGRSVVHRATQPPHTVPISPVQGCIEAVLKLVLRRLAVDGPYWTLFLGERRSKMLHIEKLKQANALDRRSPFHDRMAAQGAQFGLSSGWAHPLWFDLDSAGPSVRHRSHEQEHRATREAVGLYDVSLLSHVLVIGSDATKVLNWLSTSEMDVALGRAIYTQWCDVNGMTLNDLIVVRQDHDRYLLVVGDTIQERTLGMVQAAIDKLSASAFIVDITSGLSLLSVAGPLAREVLQPLIAESLSNASFPNMTCQDVSFGDVPVTAMRVSFTGEMTWELHVGAEYAPAIYEQLSEVVVEAGGRLCGFDAIYSCGTEKGCLDYDYNLDESVTPLEAGIGFTIAWDKPGGFCGRDALLAQRAGPTIVRLLYVCADDSRARFGEHDELIRNHDVVGRNSMATYGFTVGAMIAVAKVHCQDGVTHQWLNDGTWAVRTGTGDVPVSVSTEVLYDRQRARANG